MCGIIILKTKFHSLHLYRSKLMDELNRRNEEKKVQKLIESLRTEIQVKECEIVELKHKVNSRRETSFVASQSPSQMQTAQRDLSKSFRMQASISKQQTINAAKFFEATENKDAWNRSQQALPQPYQEACSSGQSGRSTKPSEESSSEVSLPAVLQKIQDRKKSVGVLEDVRYVKNSKIYSV